jgi:hypothetical protein
MRMMVRFDLPTTEEVNAKIRDGSIGQTMETMLGNLQPEAAYFCPRGWQARRVSRLQYGGRIRASYQARTSLAGDESDGRDRPCHDRR